jgi:hypothetical protein
MTQPYSFIHTADTWHAKASAAKQLRSNGLLGSWLDWYREVGQFQDQMLGKMHGSMVVFGINPTELL